MKKIILLCVLLTFFVNSYSQIFTGSQTILNGREASFGAIIKGSYKSFQLGICANKSIITGQLKTGVQIGVYLYNSQYVKVGSNIMFDGHLNYPSLNVTQAISNKIWYDLNLRPHYNSFLQAEFALVYCFY